MTYRERRLARAERLRGWAESRESKAEAALDGVHQIADGIPFGQPILVGHHSEGRARRDQARMESGMRSSVEHASKAASMSERAANIEAAVDRAIYDDDPDAIERLEAKVADLTAKRDRMKAANAAYRAAHRNELKAMSAYDRSQSVPYPSYALTNLGATIRTATKRLESLRRGNQPAERVIVARYGGECGECGGAIERGETILYRRGSPIRHAPACPDEGGTGMTTTMTRTRRALAGQLADALDAMVEKGAIVSWDSRYGEPDCKAYRITEVRAGHVHRDVVYDFTPGEAMRYVNAHGFDVRLGKA